MSTAAKKARKRAGIPFIKPAKTGTPFSERAAMKEAAKPLSDEALQYLARLAADTFTDANLERNINTKEQSA